MEHLTGFAPLATRYDGLILDLWGVIHDGIRAFPHAVETLARLRQAGKRTLLLSNVPRPSALVREMMRRMGIADELYDFLLTSGEAARAALRNPPNLWWAELGRRMFHLGPERDRPIFEGLPLEVVATPAEANFVLNTGPDDRRNPSDLAEFEPLLRACLEHKLPMICANPDLEVIRGGVRVLCAGALAARYRELGGDVRSLGKPDPAIYHSALELLALPPRRVLAVGDSLRTDIVGASGVGLDSCWVLGGLHRAEFLLGSGAFDTSLAEAEAKAAGLMPVATIPYFVW
jgi:HAD superfamily hydrolase (TIGR01459 family)